MVSILSRVYVSARPTDFCVSCECWFLVQRSPTCAGNVGRVERQLWRQVCETADDSVAAYYPDRLKWVAAKFREFGVITVSACYRCWWPLECAQDLVQPSRAADRFSSYCITMWFVSTGVGARSAAVFRPKHGGGRGGGICTLQAVVVRRRRIPLVLTAGTNGSTAESIRAYLFKKRFMHNHQRTA